MPLEVGDKAPDFTLPAHTGDDISLSALKGTKLIIWFYPRDFTGG